MLSQLSRASRATSAVAAVARSARAVQVRTFIAPTVSRRGKDTLRSSTLFFRATDWRRAPGLNRRDAVAELRSSMAERSQPPLYARPPNTRTDFVQELYLKELKAYKVPPVKESDAEGQVQTFAMPKTPASPEETDLAGNLKEYESMAVEIEGQDASAQAGNAAPALQDWLEAEEEEPQGH
ncbi:hypothetical protein PCL_08042 [Purpureocillium lilacinum]|uniref:ATP synthase complex subunit H n=1 Tax=Purpureocillium lilacinum TaxID=33203 RepID=A0A2U3EJN6_PURLI|nr:hypothetical protein Purlil1_2570 [Purpureocillium lilacinum]PWI74728.1 hypothetical protein PCL_08042 [Purpureocillium lilacinum]